MNLQQRIDDFLKERANAESDWDEQQSAFTDFVEMELMEQRQICAKKVTKLYASTKGDVCWKDLADASLNAVEKK